ncbi:unnamed protein product [Amoebophrya sp. A25]|nr:unnamed protein product [Amoebophrya sp. A25]|eukprot:GSA25T00016599001.1
MYAERVLSHFLFQPLVPVPENNHEQRPPAEPLSTSQAMEKIIQPALQHITDFDLFDVGYVFSFCSWCQIMIRPGPPGMENDREFHMAQYDEYLGTALSVHFKKAARDQNDHFSRKLGAKHKNEEVEEKHPQGSGSGSSNSSSSCNFGPTNDANAKNMNKVSSRLWYEFYRFAIKQYQSLFQSLLHHSGFPADVRDLIAMHSDGRPDLLREFLLELDSVNAEMELLLEIVSRDHDLYKRHLVRAGF